MLIGIATLFTMLFFGESQQYFQINKIEKGVKTYVQDKERSKEILADLRATKTNMKSFYKTRKGLLKELHALNIDPKAEKEDFEIYYGKRAEERKKFQHEMISERVFIVAKINDEEWENIISLSDKVEQKKQIKEGRKKDKDSFAGIKKAIENNLKSLDEKAQALALLQNLEVRYELLREKTESINSLESNLLATKHTSAEEFKKISEDINRRRREAYLALADFHFDMRDVADEEEWIKIMNALNKLIQ